jgi:hypothetical protein
MNDVPQLLALAKQAMPVLKTEALEAVAGRGVLLSRPNCTCVDFKDMCPRRGQSRHAI